MRHVLASGPITARPLSMREPPPAAGLVALSRNTLGVRTGATGAITGTIDLAAVATATDQHLGAAAHTHEHPG
jgi:hypothetical protein